MYDDYIVRIFLSALWGAIIGFEREYHSKSAGLRTMMMISIGSCVYTMMSLFIGSPESHDRIASNILTGIGFLGAGVIFKGTNQLNGITTAASIWVVAAVGMGIGGGYYTLATFAGLLVIIILALLPRLELWIEQRNQVHTYSLVFQKQTFSKIEVEKIFLNHRMRYRFISQHNEGDKSRLQYEIHASAHQHQQLLATLELLEHVQELEYLPA